MAYFLFFIYLLSFSLLLRYLGKKDVVAIRPGMAVAGFLLKVLLGCLYGYIFLRYYGGDDTWMYHAQSLEETRFLKTDPLHFLHSLIDPTSYTRYMMTTYWQELEYAFLIKLLAIMNVFSGGHYYVNVVLFSMISFWGGYFYYRFFSMLFPGKEKLFLVIFFLFIPLVFWTSGIRKDGLIFLSSGLVFYSVHKYLDLQRPKFLVYTALGLLLLALNRNFIALSMLPALLAWVIADRTKAKPWLVFASAYALALVVFFLTAYSGPVNLPAAFVKRQADFLALKGGSYVTLDRLEPDPFSFIKVFPQAVNHVFFRPLPGEQPGALSLFSGIETYFVLLVFILLILFPAPERQSPNRAACLAIMFFALSNYLFIGYTIPFLGAIVRYRIVFESLLLALATAGVNWQKILPGRIYNNLT